MKNFKYHLLTFALKINLIISLKNQNLLEYFKVLYKYLFWFTDVLSINILILKDKKIKFNYRK